MSSANTPDPPDNPSAPQRNASIGRDATHSIVITGDHAQVNVHPHPPLPPPANSPEILGYLKELVKDVNAYLVTRQPVPLHSKETPDAIRSIRKTRERSYSPVVPKTGRNAAQIEQPATIFQSFDEAFTACTRRMLLLGEPGAGKSTTLYEVTLNAARNRMEDPQQPVPILVPLDQISHIRFSHLRSGELPRLLHDEVAEEGIRLFQNQPLLYMLDGLDEMAGERLVDPENPEGEKYDPRAEFLQCVEAQLPHEPLVISCRITDYDEIHQKILLPGAVTLQPLSDEKIETFLVEKQKQPALWETIRDDADLLNLVRTPLLLAILSGALGEAPIPEKLRGAGDLIDLYTEQRYNHEAASRSLPFSLESVRNHLYTLAKYMWRNPQSPVRSLLIHEARVVLKQRSDLFIQCACTLNLLVSSPNKEAIEFPHLAFRDHFAVPSLIEALINEDRDVRFSAAWSLGSIGAPAIPALTEALTNGSEFVRSRAAEALGRIGPEAKAAIPALIHALEDKDADVCSKAAQALGHMGSKAKGAVPSLIQILAVKNENVRSSAAIALENIGHQAKEAAPALIEALADKNAYIRSAAARALGSIGSDAKEVVPALINALKDNTWFVRAAAARALGRIASEEEDLVPILIRTLEDDNEHVRCYVARALGKFGCKAKQAVSVLMQALDDHDAEVRVAAAKALKQIQC